MSVTYGYDKFAITLRNQYCTGNLCAQFHIGFNLLYFIQYETSHFISWKHIWPTSDLVAKGVDELWGYLGIFLIAERWRVLVKLWHTMHLL